MNKRNIFIRIVAIFLCAIMILSVVTAALYAFAAEETATVSASLPQTGSASTVWVIIAVAVALLVIVACVAVPKLKKK